MSTPVEQSVASLLRPEVRALSAYHVPDSRGLLKLDAMENPYSWPATFVDEWLERLRTADPNRYPDPACESLKASLKATHHIPAAAELMLGNGSDEIIQILLMALRPGATVMAPEPTFVMYRQISASLGLKFVGIPLAQDDFALDAERFSEAVTTHQPDIIFLAYPNNPTGNLFDRSVVEQVIRMAKGLVIVDEAYAAYASDTLMGELCRYDNLLVMRTLSKLGLAGLRLGYLAGPQPWIHEFDKVRLPYNINVLTQISALFALEQHDMFVGQVAAILRDRAALMADLSQIERVRVYPSEANFVLLRLLRHDATTVFTNLKQRGILIKNLHPQGGALTQCLRVTVGTPEQNQQFLTAFRAELSAGH